MRSFSPGAVSTIALWKSVPAYGRHSPRRPAYESSLGHQSSCTKRLAISRSSGGVVIASVDRRHKGHLPVHMATPMFAVGARALNVQSNRSVFHAPAVSYIRHHDVMFARHGPHAVMFSAGFKGKGGRGAEPHQQRAFHQTAILMLIIISLIIIILYKLYFAKMAARCKKILNTKYTKKYKLYTDNTNPMLVIGVNKRNKQFCYLLVT